MFSPDGSQLAVTGALGLWLYNVNSCKEVMLLNGHTSNVEAIAFSSDGSILAAGGEDKKIRLWDAYTRKLHAVLGGHMADIDSLSFTPDGRTFASGGADGTVLLWDLNLCLNGI